MISVAGSKITLSVRRQRTVLFGHPGEHAYRKPLDLAGDEDLLFAAINAMRHYHERVVAGEKKSKGSRRF